jgi:hypothetical protein
MQYEKGLQSQNSALEDGRSRAEMRSLKTGSFDPNEGYGPLFGALRAFVQKHRRAYDAHLLPRYFLRGFSRL